MNLTGWKINRGFDLLTGSGFGRYERRASMPKVLIIIIPRPSARLPLRQTLREKRGSLKQRRYSPRCKLDICRSFRDVSAADNINAHVSRRAAAVPRRVRINAAHNAR
ncbi:hypothetical protein KCP73_17900 [Salmonella enterica subsp. enterica]|nr:hypothetical protein KCP73_17900 [Salmonella enterica subsp. enterica]